MPNNSVVRLSRNALLNPEAVLTRGMLPNLIFDSPIGGTLVSVMVTVLVAVLVTPASVYEAVITIGVLAVTAGAVRIPEDEIDTPASPPALLMLQVGLTFLVVLSLMVATQV
ncbi:hypothetical protein D3C72_1981300 [compost metagenome]